MHWQQISYLLTQNQMLLSASLSLEWHLFVTSAANAIELCRRREVITGGRYRAQRAAAMKVEKPVVLLYDLFFPHSIWQSVATVVNLLV